MATLWKARVTENRTDSVVLTLSAVHPDAGMPSGAPSFAYRALSDSPAGGGLPWPDLGEDPGAAQVIVESAELGELRNFPFDEEAARAAVDEELRQRGLSPADENAWEDALSECWQAFWSDPKRAPTARLTIHVRDPRRIAHLVPGTEWRTSAY